MRQICCRFHDALKGGSRAAALQDMSAILRSLGDKMKIMIRLLELLVVLLLPIYSFAATVDGMPIHSSMQGKGPKTVILVHGWTCDESSWNSQAPALAKNYRVITIDLPGHGKSGSPKDGKFTLELFAKAVEAVRSEAKAERVALAGHSMGTPAIVQYARLYPQHVAALIFVDGGIMLPSANLNASFADQFGGLNGLKARENMIRSMFSASTTEAMQKHILSMMLGAPSETAVGAMKAIFAPSSLKDDICTLPVLGLYADKSRSGNSEYMKTHFPTMDYQEIPGTGHFLMLEKPDEFNRLVLGFLNKQKY
jgi:pimeloyl-ACP methyl ester carboxylesterase